LPLVQRLLADGALMAAFAVIAVAVVAAAYVATA
jgi:hypothetical protein